MKHFNNVADDKIHDSNAYMDLLRVRDSYSGMRMRDAKSFTPVCPSLLCPASPEEFACRSLYSGLSRVVDGDQLGC